MKSQALLISLLAAVAAIALTGSPALAAEANVDELKAQIEALQARVDQLESAGAPRTEAAGQPSGPGQQGWDPFDEMERMQSEMNRIFSHALSTPAFSRGNTGMFRNSMTFDNSLNMDETDKGYQITFDMHGFDKDKVDISVHDRMLTIRGQQSSQDEQTSQEAYFQAQSYGSFMRTVQLPTDADTQKMKTTRDGDQLVISIPKKA